MSTWADGSIFYHIYPLGLCGAPEKNDFVSAAVERLDALAPWLSHIKDLGANALYIGPLFESSSHGYDTVDYYHVDRRLGTDETLRRLSKTIHDMGFRLILDAVFNHVGRDFWAFKDVREKGEGSAYAKWFKLTFGKRSPRGDPFVYEGWSGHDSLVKLDVGNPGVREHLLGAVTSWVREFAIDGLRLDAADVIDAAFLRELASHCRGLRADFWLMGEVVHGDYRNWANPQTLDSVTNYECYKGLYSSLVDRNYFEIAYALNRQFGPKGMYRGLPLYAFADNHDVDRVASRLANPALLPALYCLLFTMPGVPSIYYGSEWGIGGEKSGTDRPLRPALDLHEVSRTAPNRGLAQTIKRLAALRLANPALARGDYTPLFVSHEQLAFCRKTEGQTIAVILNSSDRPARIHIELPGSDGTLLDLLEPEAGFPLRNGKAQVDPIPPHWARILELR